VLEDHKNIQRVGHTCQEEICKRKESMEATLITVMSTLLMIIKEDLGKEKGVHCKNFQGVA
jgi:hypothetical protein